MPDPAVMQGVLRHLCRAERRRRYDQLADADLLARFLGDRDEPAFEELVRRHGPMVRAVCRRVLGPSADADDAFQAAFLVLLRKAGSIRRTDLLPNWLCAVAYRTARQAVRRRSRLGARERLVEVLPEPGRPDDPPKDWLPLFDAALQRLPARYREPVVLCELQGVPRSEAARRLGLNEGTLSSRLGRARELLRRKLGRYGFPLAVGTALAPAVVPEALTASTTAAALCVGAASVSAVSLMEGVLSAMFVSKLKAGAACAAVLLVGVGAGLQFTGPATRADGPPSATPPKESAKAPAVTVPPAPPAAEPKPAGLPPEYKPFQGEWEVESVEAGGQNNTPAGIGIDGRWTFTGNILTTGGEAKADAGQQVLLDVRAKPATIDFALVEFHASQTGALVTDAFQGIYKIEPDGRLLVCYRKAGDGNLRPTRFATAPKSGATLLTLRRTETTRPPAADPTPWVPDRMDSKYTVPQSIRTPVFPPTGPVNVPAAGVADAPTVPQALPSDLDRLQGVWVAVQVDGKPPAPTGDRQEDTMEFVRDLFLCPDGSYGRVRVDETKSPRHITLTPARNADQPLTGIYQLDGDRLTIASGNKGGKLVPTTFDPDPDAGISVAVYERRKAVPPAPVAPKVAPGIPANAPPAVLAPVPEVFDIRGSRFAVPYTVADPKAVAAVHLIISDDQGQTWRQAAEVKSPGREGKFEIELPPGTYWLSIQTEGHDGRRGPGVGTSERGAQVKVRVIGDGPTPRPADSDLRKEVEQLREQLRRLERELKERKPAGPAN